MTLLACRDLSCARGGRTLFAGLSLTLEPGEATLVTGPNGVGKSSLLRVVAGLLRPASGRVDAARCALMGEASALDAERPLRAALAFWANADRGDVDAALAAVDLTHLADVPVRLLSTGQRRRAALARVVASGTPLWLLDEPANGLDAGSCERLVAIVERHRSTGGAALIATHLALPLPGARTFALAAA